MALAMSAWCLVMVQTSKFINTSHFWRDWFLFKFKGPGVHYEVAVSIRDGDIVWCHGLFPCGQLSDIESLAMALLKC